MILFFGTRPYGVVDRYRGVAVATVFVHCFFVPLVPLGSVLLVDGEATPIGWSLRSVAAAVLRVWPVVFVVGFLASWWPAWFVFRRLDNLAVLVLPLLLAAWAWTVLGRVGARDRALRDAYARVLGHAVDPACLPEREALLARLRERLQADGPTYRDAPTPSVELASDDPERIALWLTRARLEAQASGGAKPEWESLHAQLAERVRTTS